METPEKTCPSCGAELTELTGREVYQGHQSAWFAEHCTRLRTMHAIERLVEILGRDDGEPGEPEEPAGIEIPLETVGAFLGGALASSAARRGQEIGTHMAAGGKREREKIVAWLRKDLGAATTYNEIASLIEAGEYEKAGA